MKNILFLTFFTLSFWTNAQNYREEIAGIKSLKEAEQYAEEHPGVSVLFMHDEVGSIEYQNRKDTLKVGDEYRVQFYNVRVLKKGSKKLYRIRYIYLDGNAIENAKEEAEKLESELKGGASFEELHKKSNMDVNESGDLGWFDPDYLIPAMRDEVRAHKKGDIFTSYDDELKWYHVIEMTETPKKVNGHFVIFYPEMLEQEVVVTEDHGANLDQLQSEGDIEAYIDGHDDVNLHLMNEFSDGAFFEAVDSLKQNEIPVIGATVSLDEMRFRIVKDTSVLLYSFQYIFLDGSRMTADERDGHVRSIYERFNGGESFQNLVDEYWKQNKEYSKMEYIEGELLMPEVLEKLKSTEVNQLFVARTSQSYFIGIPLRSPKEAEAYLTIGYPAKTSE